MGQKQQKRKELENLKEEGLQSPQSQKTRKRLYNSFTNECDYFISNTPNKRRYTIVRSDADGWGDSVKLTTPFKIKDFDFDLDLVYTGYNKERTTLNMTHDEVLALYEFLKFYVEDNRFDSIYVEDINKSKLDTYTPPKFVMFGQSEEEEDPLSDSFIGAPGSRDVENTIINYILTKE
jgi:hypothetical protein